VRERPCCRCPLCRIETELVKDFLNSDSQDRWKRIHSAAPELAVFPAARSLLEHLRLSRETSSSDPILRALLEVKDIFRDGFVECFFVLAFLPSMHAALRQIVKRYPQLYANDVSQQALQSLLGFLDSDQLRTRKTFLGFAIARRVKRATFNWANREMGRRVFETDLATPDPDCSESSFERIAILRHFLDRAVHRGVLTDDELDLLVQFKLENSSGNDFPEHSSNAQRQRLKRLLSKLRRLAEGQTGRRPRRPRSQNMGT
jgi:hypothetical protein